MTQKTSPPSAPLKAPAQELGQKLAFLLNVIAPTFPDAPHAGYLAARAAQAVLAEHLKPDSGISAEECISLLLQALDDQRVVAAMDQK
jgi:hypothetical protein